MIRGGAVLVTLVACFAGCGRVGFAASGSGADGGPDGPDEPPADAFVGKWNLEQSVFNEDDDTISWSQTTRAGSVLIIAFNLQIGVTITGIHDQNDNVFSRIDAASATNFQGPLEIWYAVNSGDDSGDMQFDYTAAIPNAQVAWEVSGLSGDIDAVDALSDQASSTAPRSTAVTTTAPGDFVISILKADVVETLETPSFTVDSLIRDDGYAHLTANDAPAGTYQTSWTTLASMFCTSTVAFFSE
ncbi:MAG TPA: hypothetical protein VGM39_13880 [Kofleriaceae bacterium]|jgi:hypothetical protein